MISEETTPHLHQQEEKDAVDIEDMGVSKAEKTGLAHRKPEKNKLTMISKTYDEGNKGWLDEEEQVLRKADTSNEGNLGMTQMKKIARELLDEKASKKRFKYLAIFMAAGFILSIGCNFALTFVSLSLTRQLETQDGKLVDRNGNGVKTQSLGKHIGATRNPEYVRRYLKLHARRALSTVTPGSTFDFHGEFRRLVEEVSVAVLDEDANAVQQDFADYEDGSVVVISVVVGGTTYTGTVASGATYTPASATDIGCDVYGNIHEEGKPEIYEVHCCGTDPCEAFLDPSSVVRRLDHHDGRKLSYECSYFNIEIGSTPGVVSGADCPDHEGAYCFIDETFDQSKCYKVCESSSDCEDSTYTCKKEVQSVPGPLWEGWGLCQQCPNGQDSECNDGTDGSCVAGRCEYYEPPADNTGLLGEECFSSMSTVVEKAKGVMPLKDLQFGDSILASDGKFQPYLFSPHSNPIEPTVFVQIYTDDNGPKSKIAVPLEVSQGHLVFLYGYDVPVKAGNIRVGDVLVGIDNVPKKVIKVSSVTRDGFYNALTRDATLFVDGLLASSTTVLSKEDDELVQFGPFQVHVHTLVSRLGAPLNNALCNKVNSFFCETQVDDGFGGSYNIFIGAANAIVTLPLMLQGLIFPTYATLAAAGVLGYYIVVASGMIAVLLVIQYLAATLKKKVKAE